MIFLQVLHLSHMSDCCHVLCKSSCCVCVKLKCINILIKIKKIKKIGKKGEETSIFMHIIGTQTLPQY